MREGKLTFFVVFLFEEDFSFIDGDAFDIYWDHWRICSEIKEGDDEDTQSGCTSDKPNRGALGIFLIVKSVVCCACLVIIVAKKRRFLLVAEERKITYLGMGRRRPPREEYIPPGVVFDKTQEKGGEKKD